MHALFINAKTLPIASASTVKVINNGAFISQASLLQGPRTRSGQIICSSNEPKMNALIMAERLIAAQIAHLGRVSIGNSAQYQYGNKHDGERHTNRFRNRALVAHKS